MSVAQKIAVMLDSGKIQTEAALVLILQMLLENAEADATHRAGVDERLAKVEERQKLNPSFVWMFRHKYQIAIPVAVGSLLLIMLGSQFVTVQIVSAFIAKQAGVSLP